MNFKPEWIVFVFMGVCLGLLFSYRCKPNLDVNRLCSRLDHSLDLVQDLKELSMNIMIRDATDYFNGEVIDGCGKQVLLPSDIVLAGSIVDTKSKQLHDILHQLLIDIKTKGQ